MPTPCRLGVKGENLCSPDFEEVYSGRASTYSGIKYKEVFGIRTGFDRRRIIIVDAIPFSDGNIYAALRGHMYHYNERYCSVLVYCRCTCKVVYGPRLSYHDTIYCVSE